MVVAANHVGRTRCPVAIPITAPRNLHPLHSCAALVTWWGGNCNEFLSIQPSPSVPSGSARDARHQHWCGSFRVRLEYPLNLPATLWTAVRSPLDRSSMSEDRAPRSLPLSYATDSRDRARQ